VIGVFDSGYGGLTVLKELQRSLPDYDFLYLGDNARSPYGNRSFETIYEYTREAIRYLFEQGAPLVILACNTASARALRTIQQKDLPNMAPNNRVLGVLRPSAECIGSYSDNGHIGIVATKGTVRSESYLLEIEHFFPECKVSQQACPLWVPLVENHELDGEGSRYFVKKYIEQLKAQDSQIDTLLLGCTHYPLLKKQISEEWPEVRLVDQGRIVAERLVDYLKRHPEMDSRLKRGGKVRFLTTEQEEIFSRQASFFFDAEVQAEQIHL
jgi:glutamate racemase